MGGYDLRSNGFVLLAIALGFALIIISLISGASIALAFSKGVAIRTFTGTRSYVLSIADDFVLPLIGGILLVMCGLKLFRHERMMLYRNVRSSSRKAVKDQKSKVMDSLLGVDEKKMITFIGGSKDGVLQSDLVIKSGYSKVKVHRILKGLEMKGIIRRGRLGITNKVMINK